MPAVTQSPQPIRTIRLALVAGVLMFGAVILFLHGQPGWKAGALPPAVGYAQLAYAVVAVVIVMAMRGPVMRELDPPRRASLLIIGWAVGEVAALFGAVIFFITGQSQSYLLGLLAMAASLLVLRPQETP